MLFDRSLFSFFRQGLGNRCQGATGAQTCLHESPSLHPAGRAYPFSDNTDQLSQQSLGHF
ncbi:hypothetical protein LEMLEM_LOCUS25032 [Lemmus lemmus]